MNEPPVFVQVALSWQVWVNVAHSSMSKEDNSNSEEQCIKNDRSGSLPQGYFLVLHCASLLRIIS